jgi:hypothetical protein
MESRVAWIKGALLKRGTTTEMRGVIGDRYGRFPSPRLE